METLKKSWVFASFFLLSCVFTEVQGARRYSNSSDPYNRYYYERERNPINTSRDYNYMPRNIQGNIDKHINDSDISVHFSEDKSDLNDEFKNETYFKKEYLKNKTDDEFFRLGNENLNQTQSLNFSQYFRVFNDSSNGKQSTVHVKGNSKATGDLYSDRNLFTNVSLRTYNDDSETVDVDKVRQVEEIQKKFSSLGDLRYQGRNQSDSEVKEKSEYFIKRKHFFRDAAHEKDLQNSYFNQSKNVDQTNKGKRNMEKEQVLKSKSQDYEKNAAGVETLRKECLSHLQQENIYGDGKTEVKYAKSRKNRKTGFSKRLNNQTPEGGKWVTYQKFLQDCYELLPESTVSKMTIPNGDDTSRGDPFSNVYPTLPKPSQPNVQNYSKLWIDYNLQHGKDRPIENPRDDQNQTNEDQKKHQDQPIQDQIKHQDHSNESHQDDEDHSKENHQDDEDYQNEYQQEHQDYQNEDEEEREDYPYEYSQEHQDQPNEDEQKHQDHLNEDHQEHQDQPNEDEQKHQDYPKEDHEDNQEHPSEEEQEHQFRFKDSHSYPRSNIKENQQKNHNRPRENHKNHADLQDQDQSFQERLPWRSGKPNPPPPPLHGRPSKYSDASRLGDQFFSNANLTTTDVKNPIASQETTLLDAGYDVHLRNQKTIIQKSSPESQNGSPYQTFRTNQHRNPYYSSIFEDLDDFLKEFQNCNKCEENDAECKKACQTVWGNLKSQGESIEEGVMTELHSSP